MRALAFVLFLFLESRMYAQNENFLASENGPGYPSFTDAFLERENSRKEVEKSSRKMTKEKESNSESAAPVASAEALVTVVDTVNVNSTLTGSTIAIKDTAATVEEISNKAVSVKTISSRGTAMWNPIETAENFNNFYALHKYAPIGTQIKIKNPMNDRMVTVKVMGKLPNHEEYKNVVILVSAATARALHVLDGKFIVQLMIPETALYTSEK